MKLVLPKCAWLFFPAAMLWGAQLTDVHSVYLFPMAGGLDQYVANHLTSSHVYRVVSDPKLADAIFTDHIGEAFEYRLEHINPPPPPEEDEDDEDSKPVVKTEPEAPRVSSFSRGKGTIFLVDAKSKQVLWSDYERPRDTSSKQLDRTAGRIVARLNKTLTGKP
ncbi:MAG: hypothetical protein M3Z85_02025 [Acidobacteriota bacterium]|nr:hypothetical protein [Acidobacteriota bacterium]